MDRWDLVVIGGGSGGLTSAIMAGELGAKVLLVDLVRFGGDCTWHGCIPSKALIASARVAHRMRTVEAYGLKPVKVEVDFGNVMARVRAIRAAVGANETADILAHHGVASAFGGATFTDPHTLRIGADRLVYADRVVIATGSRPAPPPIDGLVDAGYLDNRSLFELTEQPRRLVVIGAGPIGCEMGQAFQRLGSEVTLLETLDRPLAREDPEVSALVAAVLRREGIDLRLGVTAEGVALEGSQRLVRVKGVDEAIPCDAVLVAIGRRANIETLGLDAAGIHTHRGSIVVDDTLATSQPHVFAVGDCNGGPQFTHWAEFEARLATRNALFRGWKRRSMARIPWVTFTEPEVARCGLTIAEAGPDAHVHQVGFDKVDRAVASGTAEGFVKVVVDRADRILGVHIVGPEAGELLGAWVLAMDQGLTLPQMGQTIHAYPTLNRANRRVADEAFFAHNVPAWVKTLGGTYRGRSGT